MDAVLLAVGVVFVAELGDKSQLLVLGFAARHRTATVFAAIVVANTFTQGVAAAAGGALGAALPATALQVGSGLLFLAFALWTWLDRDEGEEAGALLPRPAGRRELSVFVTVLVATVIAEIGDKTLLATATLAANHGFVPVWVGATVGMTASASLALLAGRYLGGRLPATRLRQAAAVLFLVFGVLLVATAW